MPIIKLQICSSASFGHYKEVALEKDCMPINAEEDKKSMLNHLGA